MSNKKYNISDITEKLELSYTDHKLGTIDTGIVKINPDLAKIALSHNIDNNRNVGKNNLIKIEKSMADGDYISLNGQQIVFGRDKSGDIILLDGQHRMQAVINTGITLPFQVAVIDKPHDVIFQGIDVGKKRSPMDMFKISHRNQKLATSFTVGYGYATHNKRIDHVIPTGMNLMRAYDANPGLVELYKSISKNIKSCKSNSIRRYNVLHVDQSVYFILYMIKKNFGNTGNLFVNSLTCFDDSYFDYKLSVNQKKCIKKIQKLFNGVDNEYDNLLHAVKSDLSYTKSDSRKKRSSRSAFLSNVFLNYFKPDKPGFNNEAVKAMITDYDLYRKWPNLGTFDIE